MTNASGFEDLDALFDKDDNGFGLIFNRAHYYESSSSLQLMTVAI